MSGYPSKESGMREEGDASVRRVKKKWRAGVLGATGIVGQRLVHLLADHPWFELTEVAASERSSGKSYAEAARWHLEAPIPAGARDLVVKSLEPALDCDFVFSGLDSSVAGTAEEDFARAGYPVVSNSRNHRMDPDVPLLIPEKLFHRRPGAGSETTSRCFRPRENFCSHAASSFRRGLSGRAVDGHSRQRSTVHQRRRRKVGA